jgi:hypothetical protein
VKFIPNFTRHHVITYTNIRKTEKKENNSPTISKEKQWKVLSLGLYSPRGQYSET